MNAELKNFESALNFPTRWNRAMEQKSSYTQVYWFVPRVKPGQKPLCMIDYFYNDVFVKSESTNYELTKEGDQFIVYLNGIRYVIKVSDDDTRMILERNGRVIEFKMEEA